MCEGWLGLGGNLGKSTDSAIHQTVGDTALYCSLARPVVVVVVVVCNRGKTTKVSGRRQEALLCSVTLLHD